MRLLKGEQIYMLEETVNVGLGARSLSADMRPGSFSSGSSSSRLVEAGRSGRPCQLFLINMYNVFF